MASARKAHFLLTWAAGLVYIADTVQDPGSDSRLRSRSTQAGRPAVKEEHAMATATPPESTSPEPSRRRFLKRVTTLGAVVVAGAARPEVVGAQSAAAPERSAPDDPTKELGAPIRPYGERGALRKGGAPAVPN